jgi:Arc/MetJ-type ribon-helix-helix transcriptional regulator
MVDPWESALRISLSLPAEDVEFLDTFRRAKGFHSRSSVLHFAIYMLQEAQLTSSYEAAWAEWEDTPDGVDWASASTHPPIDPAMDPATAPEPG